ncbi:MAG: N-acetyltransferase [Saprospiraceae bacterium]|nr:N-acetyltransferase [Saprospiraceae bacterium]
MHIRTLTPADWPQVAAIYQEGIQTGNATFQTTIPEWQEWDAAHVQPCRLVAEHEGRVVGWAALTPVSGRCVYAGVGEVSVYIADTSRGRGVGIKLLEQLIAESEAAGFWTLQAGIFPENTGSVRLHEKAGFRLVGRRERIGQMNGIWRDTLLFERRKNDSDETRISFAHYRN